MSSKLKSETLVQAYLAKGGKVERLPAYQESLFLTEDDWKERFIDRQLADNDVATASITLKF